MAHHVATILLLQIPLKHPQLGRYTCMVGWGASCGGAWQRQGHHREAGVEPCSAMQAAAAAPPPQCSSNRFAGFWPSKLLAAALLGVTGWAHRVEHFLLDRPTPVPPLLPHLQFNVLGKWRGLTGCLRLVVLSNSNCIEALCTISFLAEARVPTVCFCSYHFCRPRSIPCGWSFSRCCCPCFGTRCRWVGGLDRARKVLLAGSGAGSHRFTVTRICGETADAMLLALVEGAQLKHHLCRCCRMGMLGGRPRP